MSLIVRDTMTPTNDQQSNLNSSNPANMARKNPASIDMPSPPLSPYTRSGYDDNDSIPALLFPRASKPLTSDLRYLELISSSTSPAPKAIATSKLNGASSIPSTVPTIQVLENEENVPISATETPKADETITKLPVSSHKTRKHSVLHIDPYKQLNKPGFKKNQLDFLSQYQFKNLSSFSHAPTSSYSNNSNSYSYSNIKRPRSAVRQPYETIKSANDNSNSDSDLERPRTRRVVRQNKFDLELVDNTNSDSAPVSRPSTPVRKRVPTNASTPSTPKRQRTATPIAYNYDYKKIEDFCPSLDTLPANNKCLKTDWKGQSMDLSTDPLINELHPAEVVLASILRLPCAVYLDSKRRIFQEKVKRMKYNLPFRRTDAQKSCKIDVNKASRLFATFEKVGWFDESHFQKYL
ncbi:hypothetical protein PMKS-003209 [Pichia membranifaciens]|uniref:SWIRM domain-containing protein n=1 Tax=Pichia membranifaciens TaxID=4926 RepID=A0A1Q2YJJ1_9ASCO|nr:hypothetical protein PMKS-003209 [Pichia membranifaciens]